jgi:hypothetical protein
MQEKERNISGTIKKLQKNMAFWIGYTTQTAPLKAPPKAAFSDFLYGDTYVEKRKNYCENFKLNGNPRQNEINDVFDKILNTLLASDQKSFKTNAKLLADLIDKQNKQNKQNKQKPIFQLGIDQEKVIELLKKIRKHFWLRKAAYLFFRLACLTAAGFSFTEGLGGIDCDKLREARRIRDHAYDNWRQSLSNKGTPGPKSKQLKAIYYKAFHHVYWLEGSAMWLLLSLMIVIALAMHSHITIDADTSLSNILKNEHASKLKKNPSYKTSKTWIQFFWIPASISFFIRSLVGNVKKGFKALSNRKDQMLAPVHPQAHQRPVTATILATYKSKVRQCVTIQLAKETRNDVLTGFSAPAA